LLEVTAASRGGRDCPGEGFSARWSGSSGSTWMRRLRLWWHSRGRVLGHRRGTCGRQTTRQRGRNGQRQEAQRLLGCGGGDGDRINDGGGLAQRLVQPYARRRRVGSVWRKREESRCAAHQLWRTAALLQGGNDQQWKRTRRRGSEAATVGDKSGR
jgi:hypothetical protein